MPASSARATLSDARLGSFTGLFVLVSFPYEDRPG